LGGGVAETQKRCGHGRLECRGDKVCELFGLIELPFAFADRMQWDGDQEVGPRVLEARVLEGFQQPVGEGMAQMECAHVLEAVDAFPHEAAVPVSGDCAGEVDAAAAAVGAAEGGFDKAGEGLRAALAERGADFGSLGEAVLAEVCAGEGVAEAVGAVRWKEERERGEGGA